MTRYNYDFSADKNCKLIQERNISFEEIISAIENDCLLDVIEHPNIEKYDSQKMYIVEFNNYVYLVPFIINHEGTIFLKTIFPSRKATHKYLKDNKK